MAAYGEFLKANGEQPVTWRRAASMDEVLQQADVISLHPVLDKTTYHLVNKERLALMKKGNSSVSNKSTVVIEEEKKQRNRTAELAASSGGALALALLCNKALFPIRVPITIALTPPVARFLARRKVIKSSV
ncbi:hypothetical protein Patl1_36015 [Pistacia atlantica]|nr:hypothetical protein Patl1_36015 [Pistacia atlantica]